MGVQWFPGLGVFTLPRMLTGCWQRREDSACTVTPTTLRSRRAEASAAAPVTRILYLSARHRPAWPIFVRLDAGRRRPAGACARYRSGMGGGAPGPWRDKRRYGRAPSHPLAMQV